jgi:hypothetical protein
VKARRWQLIVAALLVLAWNAFLLWMVIYG